MTKKEQQRFDAWWRENRARLITIYNEEIDLDLAVMNIAEAVWKGKKTGKWNIGDTVSDEDGNSGVVGISWNNGDFCTIEADGNVSYFGKSHNANKSNNIK